MGLYLLLATLGLLTLLNYRVCRSVLYPPFIFSFLWLLVLTFFKVNLVETDPLHRETLILVGAGAILFSFGGIAAYAIPSSLLKFRLTLVGTTPRPSKDKFIKYLLIAVWIIGVAFFARQTINAGATGVGGNVLERARNSLVDAQNEGSNKASFLTYIPVWSTYTAVFFLVERKNRLFWIMALLAFVAAVFTTGRASILLLFSSLLGVHILKSNNTSFSAAVKLLRWPVLLFACLFTGLIFVSKDTSSVSGGVVGAILFFTLGYFVTPLAALDYVLQRPAFYSNEPHHTFKFLLQIGSYLHLLQYVPPPLFDQFVAVPLPTNVYTGYKFFLTDFGILGCLIVVAVIGFSHTLLYRKAKQGSELAIYCFGCLLYPLVMFIFDDLYSAIGAHLNMFLFGCLYLALRRIKFLPNASPAEKEV